MKELNFKNLALEIAEREDAKANDVNIAQIRTVLRLTLQILSERDFMDAMSFVVNEMLYYDRKQKRDSAKDE